MPVRAAAVAALMLLAVVLALLVLGAV